MPTPSAFLLLALALGQQGGFPVFVWPSHPGAGEIVREFGGACVMRLDDASALRAAALDFLVFNAPGRDDLHLERDDPAFQRRWQAWYDSRDDQWLVRQPCLTEPGTRTRLLTLLDESLAARSGDQGWGVSLGDEVGLTPGGIPQDVCLSPTCRAAWSDWYRARIGSEGEFHALAAISTDATRRALSDGDTSRLGPWLARREFHQQVVVELLGELAGHVRARAAGTPVGLLGIAGQSAFGGVAVERALPFLDFVECYRVGNARELAFTLREPRQRVLLTVFCDERGADFTAWQAWEHWMQGGDGLVLWSEAELAKRPAQRERLARAVRDIRAVVARVGRFRPEPRGIAVVHSAPSLALGWLKDALLDGATWPKRFQSWQEQHGTLESARAERFRRWRGAGAMPGALPLERVGPQAVARFPYLVFDHVLVLDDADLERIEGYVDAGGRLIVDGELGSFDGSGTRADTPRAERLERLAKRQRELRTRERVETLLDGRRSKVAAADEAAIETAPWRFGPSAEGWSWICTWAPSEDGWLCAALPEPRAASAAELRPSWPDEITVAAGDGVRIEWIHPLASEEGPVRLPRGDAAVFRLRRAP